MFLTSNIPYLLQKAYNLFQYLRKLKVFPSTLIWKILIL